MAASGRRSADEALAVALAAGKPVAEAAETAGLSERTAFRRLEDPAFRQHVAELRGEMAARALGRLADGMAIAADTLKNLLTAKSESVQLGAARSLLELGARLRDSVEFEERLAALERKRAEQAG